MSNIEVVQELIAQSGNNFHCQVTNYLKRKGWYTLVSPYYLDGATNKAREIDLIAEKKWSYKSPTRKTENRIHIKLFIECKYIPQINVFWFGVKDKESAEKWLTTSTQFPEEENFYTKRHHYLSVNYNNVAKLFASQKMPKVENEVIYKALNQSLNAMLYLRQRDSIIPDNQLRNVDKSTTLEFPVIICNSFENFYKVDMENDTNPEKISENFQIEVNYAYQDYNKKQNEYFLIDMVTFDLLDNFLNILEEDIKALKQLF